VSWHYLQGQEEASWEGGFSDGAPSALLRLKPTPGQSCLPDSVMESLSRSPFGMTLRRSTDESGVAALMWYQGDSPVRTYLPPDGAQESEAREADCGPSSPESLAKFNPHSYSWRTRQCSLLGGLTLFSETWPAWGMMRDGELYQLTPLVLEACGNECGLWPTPCAMDTQGSRTPESLRAAGRTERNNLKDYLRARGNWLYPPVSVAESLMLWPIGWSDTKPLAMGKFQQWLDSLGEC
jgi:hypothetical protein